MFRDISAKQWAFILETLLWLFNRKIIMFCYFNDSIYNNVLSKRPDLIPGIIIHKQLPTSRGYTRLVYTRSISYDQFSLYRHKTSTTLYYRYYYAFPPDGKQWFYNIIHICIKAFNSKKFEKPTIHYNYLRIISNT